MTGAATSRGARQAAMYLREVLNNPPYRTRWARSEVAREQRGRIHQAAVAQVLASYLWDYPRRVDDRNVEADQLKDLVSRALSGRVLSRQTLQLFIDAFAISREETAVLWRQWTGEELARVIFGELSPLAPGRPEPPRYQTILLHEFHYLGPDGRPVSHRTIQDIRALVDDVATHRYSFDTSEVEIERVQGGTPSAPYHLHDDVWAVDLTLPRVLNYGDMASMEYITRFRYTHDVEPMFRRVAHQRFEKVAIRVQFDPARLPRRVWWAEWEDYRIPNDRMNFQKLVELDAENAAYHCLDVIERAVAGFVWEF